MKRIAAVLVGAMMLCAVPAMAEEAPKAPAVVTSADGSMSMQLPADGWKVTEDENHLLVLSDGDDIITVDHLNADATPAPVDKANDTYAAVYQAYVSTRNEIFAVKGAVVNEADVVSVMQAISTLRILNMDTVKKAAQESAQNAAAQSTAAPELKSIDATWYVTGDDVNVRSGCSVDQEVLGTVNRGDQIHVDGAVLKDGQENGWCQVRFKDQKAYISAQFLTATAPAPAAASAPANTGTNTAADAPALAYCPYCGQWYEEGNIFRNHICPARDAANAAANDDDDEDLVQCEFCGGWYAPGNEYRNHICPARDAAYSAQEDTSSDDGSDLVQCEYCGQWFQAGNEFRNHICPARDEAYAEE